MPSILLDHKNLMAFARVTGFLDADEILRLTADTDNAIRAFGGRMSQHGRLFDLTDAKVASPESISALCRMTVDPARVHLRANRVAYFGASPLLARQIRRICAVRSSLAMFDDSRAAFAVGDRRPVTSTQRAR